VIVTWPSTGSRVAGSARSDGTKPRLTRITKPASLWSASTPRIPHRLPSVPERGFPHCRGSAPDRHMPVRILFGIEAVPFR
jgi:hypothetical protein